jgi:CheY-like chemotaxis protein
MPTKVKNVYVVDDEWTIAITLATILQKSGYEALAFTSPIDALVATQSQAPDLLISDVMMPKMNGVELAIKFKSAYPRCGVLLFSGQAATADLLETARKQGHEFTLLSKPMHPTDLLAAIKSTTV